MVTKTLRVTASDSTGLQSAPFDASYEVQTASQPVPTNFGEQGVLNDDFGNAGLLIAQKVAIGFPGTLQSLSFYVGTVAGQLRLGLYKADGTGGNPGTLVAQTNAFTPTVGWNTQAVSASLLAGDYWLAYTPSSNSLHMRSGAGGNLRHVSRAFQAMPATFPANPLTIWDGTHFSFYCTVLVDSASLPPPDPPGFISYFNPTAANWSDPSRVDNIDWFNHHGGKPWSLTKLDDFTLRMEIRQGDPEAIDVGAERSEFASTPFPDNVPLSVDYDLTILPGAYNNPPAAWIVLTQFHDGGTIPASLWLVDGEKMSVSINEYVTGAPQQVWTDTADIVRGQTYHIHWEFRAGNPGYVRFFRDGVKYFDFTGLIGSSSPDQIVKVGIYRGWNGLVTQTMAVTVANIHIVAG